jgi:CDP-diacylglycerol--glycerol-3-phosphate 3-phosphatidyltransferase
MTLQLNKFSIELLKIIGKLMTMLKLIPNILTIGRLVLTIIFLVMIVYAPDAQNMSQFLDIAFIIFLFAGLTDIIDGKIARMLNVTSKFGRMMDPLADKVLVCGAFIFFALIGQPKLFDFSPAALKIIHWSVAAILIIRELYVTTIRHLAEAKGIAFAATSSGKIKMFLQSFAIGTVIIKMAHVPTALWGSWFTTITYLIMIFSTVLSGIRAMKRDSRVNQK